MSAMRTVSASRSAAAPVSPTRRVSVPSATTGRATLPAARSRAVRKSTRYVVTAAKGDDWSDEDDAEFEARLAALRTAKGAVPMGQSRKGKEKKDPEMPTYVPKTYDFVGEELYYEGPPARGDLATNILLGATILWIPLTIAAIGRGIFIKYKFTNKRFSVETNAPWQTEKTDVAYQEVAKVVSIPRGVGLWGDMVVTLRNGDKVELRALDRFKELEKYILDRKAELTGEK